ncbi:MAG TPA: YicC/YloC family endoribonuclease [Thermoanaerobaculaceae bacterium]|nr:YicC/YloC family endoribonuclease [Thermoanaerobaculaceae bacterium]
MAGELRSMTGFGQAQGEISDRLGAEVRIASVNSRFLEVTVRTHPRIETAELEAAVRPLLAGALTRGRVQVTIELRPLVRAAADLALHWEVAERLVEALRERPAGLELAPLALRDLLALPGFAEGGGELALTADEMQAVLALAGRARDALVKEREREAAALMPQVRGEASELSAFQSWLAGVNEQVRAALFARLRERLAALLEGTEVDQQRLLQEAAIAAERSDVAEEIQRLAAHLAHLDTLLAEGGPVGKKIDFLLQELLREVNTAASKCREVGMGERVVVAKAALEKLREQCANLE